MKGEKSKNSHGRHGIHGSIDSVFFVVSVAAFKRRFDYRIGSQMSLTWRFTVVTIWPEATSRHTAFM